MCGGFLYIVKNTTERAGIGVEEELVPETVSLIRFQQLPCFVNINKQS